jgi:preprotein translocase subunit YajC
MTEVAYAMGAQGGQDGGGILVWLPWILIFVVFYFLLIRPQQKRQKEHRTLLDSLRKGDRVVTSSGMFGTIVGINEKENIVVLKVSENVKIEFLRTSIAGRISKGE